MASRRKSRILAFQALYAWESNRGMALTDTLSFAWLGEDKLAALDTPTLDFSRLLVRGTVENIAAVDEMIKGQLVNWEMSRLGRVDLAIIRMSVYTLMFQPEMPPSIVINEAIGISREFGGGDSYKFVNGVLDGIRKKLGLSATGTSTGTSL